MEFEPIKIRNNRTLREKLAEEIRAKFGINIRVKMPPEGLTFFANYEDVSNKKSRKFSCFLEDDTFKIFATEVSPQYQQWLIKYREMAADDVSTETEETTSEIESSLGIEAKQPEENIAEALGNNIEDTIADIESELGPEEDDDARKFRELFNVPEYAMLLDVLTMCNGLPPSSKTTLFRFDPEEWRQKAKEQGWFDLEPPPVEALQMQQEQAISGIGLSENIRYTKDILDEVKASVKLLTGKTVTPRFPPRHVNCLVTYTDPKTKAEERFICTHIEGGFHVTSQDGNKHKILLFPCWHSYGTGGADHFYQNLVVDWLCCLNGAHKKIPDMKVTVDPVEWKNKLEQQQGSRWILPAPNFAGVEVS